MRSTASGIKPAQRIHGIAFHAETGRVHHSLDMRSHSGGRLILEASVRKTNKVIVGGIVALLASATLAACGDAPEDEPSSGTEQRGGSERLPALHRVRRGRLRRQVLQPARLRGRHAGGRRAGRRADRRRVQQRERLRPQPGEPRRRGLRRHRHGRLRTVGGHRRVGQGQPGHRVRPHRRRGRQRLRRHQGRGQHQAAALQHRRGRVPGRLRGRRLHQDRHRRHLRRHAVPDRHDLHGRLQAGRRLLRRGRRARTSRSSASRTARPAPSPVASRPTRRPPARRAASSTRTPT